MNALHELEKLAAGNGRILSRKGDLYVTFDYDGCDSFVGSLPDIIEWEKGYIRNWKPTNNDRSAVSTRKGVRRASPACGRQRQRADRYLHYKKNWCFRSMNLA